MLSAIFAVTEGDALISSLFSRTAAMREAAMSITELGFFSSLLLLLLLASLFRLPRQAILGDGGPLKTSVELYR